MLDLLNKWPYIQFNTNHMEMMMTRGTKEFYDMIDAFEKCVKSNSNFSSLRLKKYEKGAMVPPSEFYENGETNKLFHAFMLGYSFGRI